MGQSWCRRWSWGRGRWCFFCRRFRLGRSEQICKVLSFLAQHAKHAVDRSRCALVHANVEEHAVLERLKFHRGFVRLDFSQELSAFDLVSYFLVPFSDHPFCHGVAQFGHPYNFSHGSRSINR